VLDNLGLVNYFSLAHISQTVNMSTTFFQKCIKIEHKSSRRSHFNRGNNGMAKALGGNMNYYEKLVKKMNQSMKEHPHSAMVMDMSNFAIIAKGTNFTTVSRKLPDPKVGARSIIFQKPSEKVTWIL
jgi:hypothetical protein